MISRRAFIRTGGLVGSSIFLAGSSISKLATAIPGGSTPHFAVAEGPAYFDNTRQAIEAVGGMKAFISPGDKISILINAKFDYEGAYVEPLVPLAVIRECHQAGASTISILQVVPEDYWERVPEPEKYKELLQDIEYVTSNDFPAKFNEDDFIKLEKIEGCDLLTNLEVVKRVFECDKFISIAVAKHHAGTLYTGLLKNMMGLFTRETNVSMHLDQEKRNNPERLAQCLADIHSIRKPDLYVLDATRFITTNGPVGPGEVQELHYIAAGTDPVAMDVFGAEWNGHHPEDILMIRKAYEKGLGEMNKDKIIAKWISS